MSWAWTRIGIVLLLIGFLLQVLGCGAGQSGRGSPQSRQARSASPTSPMLRPTEAPREITNTPLRRKPNIVLLMTDDQTLADLSVMPRTRRSIGRRGATFTRAFSSYPLCCPARTTVLTGQHAHNHGVMGNWPPWGGFAGFRRDEETLPVWLQRAGYRTALLGKYLNGYPRTRHRTYLPPGWSDWYVPVRGAYNYRRQVVNENGRLVHRDAYQSEYVARRAIRLIRSAARGPQPLFLWASFLAPHVGLPVERDDPRFTDSDAVETSAVQNRYRDSLRHVRLPHRPSLNEADMTDKAPFMHRLWPMPVGELQEAYQQRLESLRSVDDAVGRIIEALRATRQLRNTYVVFASDNGFLVGQHRWYFKTLGYEESIRIPLLMRGPDLPGGVQVHQQVSLADLSATITGIAEAIPTRRRDGVSLLRMVGHPKYLRNRPVLLEAGGRPLPWLSRLYVGVRSADGMVLLEWYDGTEEVYDLRTDPFQLDGRVSHREQVELPRLRRLLALLRNCVGTTCRDPLRQQP